MNNEASISYEYHYGTSSWTLFSLILFLIISITTTEVVLKDIIVHVGTVTTFCHSWAWSFNLKLKVLVLQICIFCIYFLILCIFIFVYIFCILIAAWYWCGRWVLIMKCIFPFNWLGRLAYSSPFLRFIGTV